MTLQKPVLFYSWLVLLSGCSSLSDKFVSSEEVNLEPFAARTIEMVRSLDYGLERDESLYMREYLRSGEIEEVNQLIKLDEELYHSLKGIVAYSLKVVSLSRSSKTDKQQVEAYADYIDNLEKPTLQYHLKKGTLSETDYQNFLVRIRKQEDLLAAMQAAKPMIKYISDYIDSLVWEIKNLENRANISLQDAIDSEYATEIKYNEMLLNKRDAILSALILIDDYYKGKKSALTTLEKKRYVYRLGLKTKDINPATLHRIEYELQLAFESVQKQFDLLDPDYDVYIKTHQELDKLVVNHDAEIRKAKEIIQLWLQAHQKMSEGVTDPAEWFDITDPGGNFLSLTTKLLLK